MITWIIVKFVRQGQTALSATTLLFSTMISQVVLV